MSDNDAAAVAQTAGSGGRPPWRRPVSFGSRQSTCERVGEILLQNARARAESMGTPAPPAPPRSLARRRSSHARAGGEQRQHQAGGDRVPDDASGEDDDDDEMTGIVSRGSGHDYLSTQTSSRPWPARRSVTRRQLQQDPQSSWAREHGRGDEQAADGSEKAPWWWQPLGRFQSIELENKGSVARDHLALERTFLAWLRTSLAFASIGIAVTQLFRLNTSLTEHGGRQGVDKTTLWRMGKPLGAAFLGISIVTLLMGFRRYFHAQEWVMRGKFSASRGTIVVMALAALAIMLLSLVVVIVIQPAEEPRGL